MSKKCSSKVPVPDPTAIATAQADANTKSAQEQAALNRVGTNGPYGSTNWSQDPSGQWVQNTTLNPQTQALLDQQQQAMGGALNAVSNSNINLGALPSLQSSFEGGGNILDAIASAGDIQRSVGPTDFTADREAVTDAVWNQAMSRLNPLFSDQQRHQETSLANQGISINSAAYGNASDQLGRTQTDARNQALYGAIQQGANEQNTLFNQALNKGQFVNAAQAQQYGQNANDATFTNSAQAQRFGQNHTLAEFNNAARAQGFGEQTTQDQLNIARLAAIYGATPQMPDPIQYTPTAVGPTDVTGAYALQQDAQKANAANAQSAQNGLMSGLFGLGAAALTGGASLPFSLGAGGAGMAAQSFKI